MKSRQTGGNSLSGVLFGGLIVVACVFLAGNAQADRGDVPGDDVGALGGLTNWVFDPASGSYYLPGDANDDGKVDGADLAAWQTNYNPLVAVGTSIETGDWNGDSKIDGSDLAIWQMNYDPIGSEAPVVLDPIGEHAPEPITMIGLVMGVGGLGAYLRKRNGRQNP